MRRDNQVQSGALQALWIGLGGGRVIVGFEPVADESLAALVFITICCFCVTR
jgi:hypothetical protein